jgi:hypothetical protein
MGATVEDLALYADLLCLVIAVDRLVEAVCLTLDVMFPGD